MEWKFDGSMMPRIYIHYVDSCGKSEAGRELNQDEKVVKDLALSKIGKKYYNEQFFHYAFSQAEHLLSWNWNLSLAHWKKIKIYIPEKIKLKQQYALERTV